MYIRSNVSALQIWNNWNQSNQQATTALQRISSGKKILSAADDAAGLATAQKMKARLRSCIEGQRLAATQKEQYDASDAILGNVQSMLARMQELATQSATGTYLDSNRESMDKEYQELMKEINRILPTASLSSSFFSKGSAGVKSESYRIDDVEGYMEKLNGFLDEVGTAVSTGDEEAALRLGIDLKDGLTDSQRIRQAVSLFAQRSKEEFASAAGSFLVTADGVNVSLSMDGGDAEELGLSGTNLLSDASAQEAMEAIRSAMETISNRRSGLGAMSSAMESMQQRLATMEENLTDALSRIEDADMAKEIMSYVKNQMISQVNAFLMSQTIHRPEQILKMIKNP